jgi:hypothetical protein
MFQIAGGILIAVAVLGVIASIGEVLSSLPPDPPRYYDPETAFEKQYRAYVLDELKKRYTKVRGWFR